MEPGPCRLVECCPDTGLLPAASPDLPAHTTLEELTGSLRGGFTVISTTGVFAGIGIAVVA